MKVASERNAPRLPTLEEGINLLSAPRGGGALQSLVLNQLILDGGMAYWVDSHDNARTDVMADVAPSMRFLDRIMVARSFTPFQHYATVDKLPGEIGGDCSVVVLSEADYLYREGDTFEGEARDLLRGVMEVVERVAECVPVVLTLNRLTGLGELARSYVDESIACRVTEMGPRFVSSDFETLVYRNPGYVQTTLALWRRVLHREYRRELREVGGVRVGAD